MHYHLECFAASIILILKNNLLNLWHFILKCLGPGPAEALGQGNLLYLFSSTHPLKLKLKTTLCCIKPKVKMKVNKVVENFWSFYLSTLSKIIWQDVLSKQSNKKAWLSYYCGREIPLTKCYENNAFWYLFLKRMGNGLALFYW